MTFSLDKGCKVAKVFLGKKWSNEKKEDESGFLWSSEEEDDEKGSDLRTIEKDLDPDFLLKRLDANFFVPRSHFIWRTNLLLCKCLLSLKWKIRRKLTTWWRGFEETFFLFRRIVLAKKWRWSWKSCYLLDWRKDLLNKRCITKSSLGSQRWMRLRIWY